MPGYFFSPSVAYVPGSASIKLEKLGLQKYLVISNQLHREQSGRMASTYAILYRAG
jgi:hypothetical protein